MRSRAAHTQPPACASTALRPMARSSVLLPDMFEPVTSSSVPGGPDLDVVGDPSLGRDQRMAEGFRGQNRRRRRSPACTSSGLSRRAAASADSASSSPIASSHARTRRPAVAAPSVEREQDVKVPQRERLNRKVQDRRAAAQRREPENAIQPPHAGGRRDAVRRQPLVQVAQRRGLEARSGGVLEQPGIARQRVLSRAGPIECGLSPLRHRERQDEAEHERNQPEGRVDDVRSGTAQAESRSPP